ncbi:MAG: hypothetical protein QXG17_04840 [Sulfolobales archaeon]
MSGALDILAIVYAYLLAFIILGMIVFFIRISSRFLMGKVSKPQAPRVEAPAVRPEVTEEAPKHVVTDEAKVAVAVAAVATHLSLQGVRPSLTISHAPYQLSQPWVNQWRAQVSKSLNELCLTKYFYKRTRTA